MTVEDKRDCMTGEDSAIDKFPIGMRVLAVDDDPICLKVLENLLRKCHYQVTITNQAITALKMLRENREKYDLVISDVSMPDMDGFKLLELLGLEMDLPVIMLSAHSDTKLVMKGVTHGACDYLLKPVRIEELKNIWQHVIRRKKIDPKDQNKSPSQENALIEVGERGQGATSAGKSDQNGNSNRKRKDQYEIEEEECDNDGHENEESTTQKKPRVVWSVELHKKFVGAVNQLGLDKAVPKKILDLMNVDGLTRENVASHLQKYRLYLKRISTVASHQAGMAAALGSKDSSYLHMGSLDRFVDLRSLNSSGQISSPALSSYSTSSMLGRLNSTAGLTIRGIASSGIIQPSHSQTLTNQFNTLTKIKQAMLPTNSNANFFQGVNQMQQSKSAGHVGGNFNHISDPTAFTASSVTLGGSSSCVSNASCNPLMFQANAQQAQSRGAFGNQSSLNVASPNPESFDMGVCVSCNFLDHDRCDENLQGAVQLSKFPSNSSPLSESFSRDDYIASNPLDISSSMVTSSPLEDSRGDISCQAGMIGNIVQNYTSRQQWVDDRLDYNTQNFNNSFSTVNSLVSGSCSMGPFGQNMDQSNASLDMKLRSNDDYLLDQCKSPEGFIQNNYDSLYDIVNTVIKRDPAESLLVDGGLVFDAYSLRSCM